MKITTTLNRIKEHKPCVDGWKKLRKHLGPYFDGDDEFYLLEILESNGVEDALWALRATVQSDASAFIAIAFAERVLPIFESRFPDNSGPRLAIEAARIGDRIICAKAAKAARRSATTASVAATRAVYALGEASETAYAAMSAANAARCAAEVVGCKAVKGAAECAAMAAGYATSAAYIAGLAKEGFDASKAGSLALREQMLREILEN